MRYLWYFGAAVLCGLLIALLLEPWVITGEWQ